MGRIRNKTHTAAEADVILEKTFKGVHCCLTLPGKEPVYGIVNQIALDPLKIRERQINIQLNGSTSLYTCELQWLHECLKPTKKKQDEDTNNTGT